MTPVEVMQGTSPVVLGMPHTGTFLPPETLARLNAAGQLLADTDWHIDQLYDGLLPGATVVKATFHRYVIDANRPPGGESLYPGQNSTGLVPLTDFNGQSIWSEPPGEAEIAHRRETFHAPYHAALSAELERVRDIHGVAVLYDCHSIRSEIPYLFAGILPDLNLGTVGGTSCHPALEALVQRHMERAPFTAVTNGRFKGGWTTRHYGRPADGIHALQMELAQSTHLMTETPPFAYDEVKAARLRPVLQAILQELADTALTLGGKA